MDKLRELLIDRVNDMEIHDSIEIMSLCLDEIVGEAVERAINELSTEKLVELTGELL